MKLKEYRPICEHTEKCVKCDDYNSEKNQCTRTGRHLKPSNIAEYRKLSVFDGR